ncbi:MAG: M15 family metallopeptidase [Chloracidobacterium sp.]|nr:M15 family metallopeptidase [Chloracidobacterium sp.]MDW8216016.1 M15 family metallopeptidase [Acidobacteriota bacterium]
MSAPAKPDSQFIDKSYLLGKFDPARDSRFVKLEDRYTAGAARCQYLRRETYAAFVKMAEDAKKDNIELIIVSATRNFDRQKDIWETKWKERQAITDPVERARDILRYSSMPGTSRHHWGTDIDLNSLEDDYFKSAVGLAVYQWLVTHAGKYGFCQPYTSKEKGRTGYEEEKWHWSYTPLSVPLLQQYLKTITLDDITGFQGSETAVALDVIRGYVAGVDCQ